MVFDKQFSLLQKAVVAEHVLESMYKQEPALKSSEMKNFDPRY